MHISGLDHVAQPVIEEFIAEHAPNLKHRRLEWIDDSSLNIVYHKPEDAAAALILLSVEQDTIPLPSQERPAKTLASRPDLQFSLRQARVSDKKKPGAKDRSAFYLFNPEWDPENRKYDGRYDRRGRGRRDGHRNDSRRDRPRREVYTDDMYDDAPADDTRDLARRMSTASITSEAQDLRQRRQGDGDNDLFSRSRKRDQGRLRDRSRSPERDGDGRYGFGEDRPRNRMARRRSWTPPAAREPRVANVGKELFADRAASAASTPPVLSTDNRGIDLFPNHSSKRSRELFPHKTAHSNHRRSDAMTKQETDDIVKSGKQQCSLHTYHVRLTYLSVRSLGDRMTGGPDAGDKAAPKGLADRITDRPDSSAQNHSLADRINGPKGLADRISGGPGASNGISARVKELFPEKGSNSSNSGRELFPSRRGRRRAEDYLDSQDETMS